MKITVKQAVRAYLALEAMAKEDIKVSPGVGMCLIRLKRKLKPEMESFAEAEQKLVQQYAERDENGDIQWVEQGRFAITPEQGEAYLRDLEEINNAEIKLLIDPIDIRGEDIRLGLEAIEALDGLVIME